MVIFCIKFSFLQLTFLTMLSSVKVTTGPLVHLQILCKQQRDERSSHFLCYQFRIQVQLKISQGIINWIAVYYVYFLLYCVESYIISETYETTGTQTMKEFESMNLQPLCHCSVRKFSAILFLFFLFPDIRYN